MSRTRDEFAEELLGGRSGPVELPTVTGFTNYPAPDPSVDGLLIEDRIDVEQAQKLAQAALDSPHDYAREGDLYARLSTQPSLVMRLIIVGRVSGKMVDISALTNFKLYPWTYDPMVDGLVVENDVFDEYSSDRALALAERVVRDSPDEYVQDGRLYAQLSTLDTGRRLMVVAVVGRLQAAARQGRVLR